jgi:hypothetical protein
MRADLREFLAAGLGVVAAHAGDPAISFVENVSTWPSRTLSAGRLAIPPRCWTWSSCCRV